MLATEIWNKISIADLSPVFGRAIKETFLSGSINSLLSDLEPKGELDAS